MTLAPSSPVFVPYDGRPPKPGVVRFVDVSDRPALAIDGTDLPGAPGFQKAIGALYTLAWTLKFQLKARDVAYKVAPLEGIWSAEGGTGAPIPDPTATWHWTLLIEMPPEVTTADLAAAAESGRTKHPEVRIDQVELRTIEGGRFVEALHVGPYATEPETFARMAAAVESAGLKVRPSHVEIYLGDPTKAAPDKLKTLLRRRVE